MREVRDTSQLLTSRESGRTGRLEVASCGDACHSIVRPLALIGSALAAATVVWRFGFRRITVSGPSMIPTLDEGDRVLVRRVRRVRVGDIVVADDPLMSDRVLIKRVADISTAGVFVVGDNAGASRDSREFGPLPTGAIWGVAWYRYLPQGRSGRIARPRVGVAI
jgi:nickel-type superoxide dismutase maturation protease